MNTSHQHNTHSPRPPLSNPLSLSIAISSTLHRRRVITTTMNSDWWLRSAISDDAVVADILLHLKHSPSPFSFSLSPLPPSWGLRQPRSKPDEKQNINPRCSPTTPLSWTGCSASPSDVGCDESTSPNLFRSKICAASDVPTTSSKRPKRKKTFAQLKEEESSLLKERIYLEKELATLHMTLKEQRSINMNLKRIKLDLLVESGTKPEFNSEPAERIPTLLGSCEVSSSIVSKPVKTEDASLHLCLSRQNTSSQEPVFVLPDLNMSPDGECDLVGMS